ncbi:esterase [Halobacteriales archaeon QS_4_70_19]|nr:MAG: esterase [Halobacteriales archaeon QS_4_70_19]
MTDRDETSHGAATRRRFLRGVRATGTVTALAATGATPVRTALADTDSGADLGDGTWTRRTVDHTVNGNTTERVYYAYLPPSYDASTVVPLVTMLHGCDQDPEGFAVGTEMNELADEETFLAIYPDQTRDANSSECWNWFDDHNQHRGGKEARLIATMTRDAMDRWAVDGDRVYVCGMSAGGAQAVNQAVTYPDLYAAVASHSGLEYDAANDATEAVAAMETGGPDPDVAGERAYEEMVSNGVDRVVPAYVVHGDVDTTVRPVNGEQTARQWLQTNDLADDGADDDSVDATPDTTTTGTSDGGYHYTVERYEDESGDPVVTYVTEDELGHNWSGGDADGPNTDPLGEPVTPRIWSFFERNPQ